MNTAVKRKNYYLDEAKIKRVQRILGTKTETETLDKAMDIIMFRTELLESLKRFPAKAECKRYKPLMKYIIDTDLYIELLRTGQYHDIIAEIYTYETPNIYFSSVVAQELLSGVVSEDGRKKC